MNVLLTGANGFIGKNLKQTLRFAHPEFIIYEFNRDNTENDLKEMLPKCCAIIHLAGENRPTGDNNYYDGNVGLTKLICKLATKINPVPIIFSSSTQVIQHNEYGQSKLEAELILKTYADKHGFDTYNLRLPNVFGKWSKPNYNSVIATWCYNISRDIEIRITDSSKELNLTYIDDVVGLITRILLNLKHTGNTPTTKDLTSYKVKLGTIAKLLKQYNAIKFNLLLPEIDTQFKKSLYSTYLSFLPCENFSYKLPKYSDARGDFLEVLKNEIFGQVSISTSKPNVTRGNHFHHTKNEKFLVISGSGLVRFRKVGTSEIIKKKVTSKEFEIIDIPPGYVHNITNIGTDELILLIWANEVLDKKSPDTHAIEV